LKAVVRDGVALLDTVSQLKFDKKIVLEALISLSMHTRIFICWREHVDLSFLVEFAQHEDEVARKM